MKTAHQLARELLSGPDLPIFHFDPSFLDSCDEETDTTLGTPNVELNDPAKDGALEPERIAELVANGFATGPFLTISGDQPEDLDRQSDRDIDSRRE